MLKIGRAVAALALLLLASPQARAQTSWTDTIFVSVNGGYQVTSTDFESTANFEVYEEPSSLTATQSLGSGLVFDVSAGYRFRGNLGFGVGLSMYSSESDVLVNARVPHPLFFDQFRTVSVTANGAKHRSIATNLNVIWFWPFSDTIDFAFSAGPSIVAVNQELISAITIAPEQGPSYVSPEITDITVTEQRKTALGFNAGVDSAYMLTSRYGVGVSVRYLWSSADLEGLADSLSPGGLQVLGGLRVRF